MYRVRIVGDPFLRKVAQPVSEFTDPLHVFLKDMIKIMHKEDGIGLAAPQIGFSRRIVVVDISPMEETEEPRVFINPQIMDKSGESVIEEGCLSVPDIREKVTRPEEIILKYQDENGTGIEETYNGWLARVLQHEIDHLNGILFVDYLSPIKKQMLINQGALPNEY